MSTTVLIIGSLIMVLLSKTTVYRNVQRIMEKTLIMLSAFYVKMKLTTVLTVNGRLESSPPVLNANKDSSLMRTMNSVWTNIILLNLMILLILLSIESLMEMGCIDIVMKIVWIAD